MVVKIAAAPRPVGADPDRRDHELIEVPLRPMPDGEWRDRFSELTEEEPPGSVRFCTAQRTRLVLSVPSAASTEELSRVLQWVRRAIGRVNQSYEMEPPEPDDGERLHTREDLELVLERWWEERD